MKCSISNSPFSDSLFLGSSSFGGFHLVMRMKDIVFSYLSHSYGILFWPPHTSYHLSPFLQAFFVQNEVTCTYVYGFSSLFYMDLPPPVTSTSPQSLPASPSLLLQSHPPSRPAHLQSQPLNLVSLTWKPLPLHRLSSGGLLQATGRTSFHFPQHFLVLRTRLPVAALSQAQFLHRAIFNDKNERKDMVILSAFFCLNSAFWSKSHFIFPCVGILS